MPSAYTRRWKVRRRSVIKALALAGAVFALGRLGSPAKAQRYNDFLHWPYVPPQTPGNGFEYRSLYDTWYVYPREQRIVPQIQGAHYRNFYGGKRVLGIRKVLGFYDIDYMKKYYVGNHFALDV